MIAGDDLLEKMPVVFQPTGYTRCWRQINTKKENVVTLATTFSFLMA